MTTLIEKEALLKKFETGALLFQPEVREIIEEQPEALVRCKECKYSEHWYKDKRRCWLWHEAGIDVFEDGFCNYAERRTDE